MSAPATLLVQRIEVRHLRNLSALGLDAAERVNVIAGDNGQGKSSVLEALYLALTSRSFRTERIREMLQQGESAGSALVWLDEAGLKRRQRALLSGSSRTFSVDDKRERRMADYALRSPVVVFHAGDLGLTSGPASGRRTLLDRVGLYLEPISGDVRKRYVKAQQERHRALQDRGPSAPELDVFEQLMAEQGARLQQIRQRSAERLTEALRPIFISMAAPGLELGVQFNPGGSMDPEFFRERLRQCRAQDLRRRSAAFGPHRDELELSIDGRTAREHASQGQQRLLSLALKVAELHCIRDARNLHPILLLDDVASELDPIRTGAVYEYLRDSHSQLWVTTTRSELFLTPGIPTSERSDFFLKAGQISAAHGTALDAPKTPAGDQKKHSKSE